MREGKNLILKAVSEWLDCYIDYQYLQIYIAVITELVNQVLEFQQTLEIQNAQIEENYQSNRESQSIFMHRRTMILQEISNLKKELQQINKMFFKAFKFEVQVCYLFCTLKEVEVVERYRMCLKYEEKANEKEKKNCLLPYSQYAYVQAAYLKKMEESNIQAERKILKKHKKYSQNLIEVPEPFLKDNLNVQQIKKQIEEFEDFYVQLSFFLSKKNKKNKKKYIRDFIRNIAQQKESKKSDKFIFGLWIGIFLAVILFMVLLLIYQKKSVQTDPIFNRDFPTWRGIAYIIFYIWILGGNIFLFQRFKISHRIIFGFNDHHYLRSIEIFKLASLFSSIFATMFTVYALNLAEIIHLGLFYPQYLSLIIWGLFILMLFNPLPIIYFQSRKYTIKLFFRIIFSPAIGVHFVIGWATDQLLSLITPFQDMVYSVCYFTSLDFSDTDVSHNFCRSPARLGVFIFAATIFSYRIFQCIRQGYDKKKYFFQHQFFNTVKYIFSLLTLVLSYQWKGGNQNIFAAWLTFAISSTIYSYVWDLKVDWALLQKKSPYCLLREELIYHHKSYYVMMLINLILRLAWVLTFSQNITDKTFGSPEIFRLVTGALQIIRRGVWNLLRLEKQQLKNNTQFKAIPAIREKYESQIKSKLNENKEISNKLNYPTQQRIVEENMEPVLQLQIGGGQQSKQPQSPEIIFNNSLGKVKNLKQLRQKMKEVEQQKRNMLTKLDQNKQTADSIIRSIKTIISSS